VATPASVTVAVAVVIETLIVVFVMASYSASVFAQLSDVGGTTWTPSAYIGRCASGLMAAIVPGLDLVARLPAGT
jgi:hypothetical protein